MKTPVKEGWFIDAIHDAYHGFCLIGPFLTEEDAVRHNMEKSQQRFDFDEVRIKEFKYVEIEGEVFPLYDSADRPE